MTREEYLAKRKAYYQKNKHKWAEYQKAHREEINAKSRERRANNLERYREVARIWRDNNRDKISEYQKKYHNSGKGQLKYREYYEQHKLEFYERNKKSVAKYPDERRVHSIVSKHLYLGKIEAKPCEICGNPKVDAHHDDYNKPLDIRWLCRKCHADWHSKNEPVRAANKKKCAVCDNTFVFTHRSQKFCSDTCRAKWNKEKSHQYYLENIDKWKNYQREKLGCRE